MHPVLLNVNVIIIILLTVTVLNERDVFYEESNKDLRTKQTCFLYIPLLRRFP